VNSITYYTHTSSFSQAFFTAFLNFSSKNLKNKSFYQFDYLREKNSRREEHEKRYHAER